MAGEARHGVTVMHLAGDLDAGDVIIQQEVKLDPGADAGQARMALAEAGGGLLVTALDLLASGTAPRVRQDHGAATWAPKLSPADERITWEMTATEIVNRVRALSPSPGAYFESGGQRVKLLAASAEQPGSAAPKVALRHGAVCGRRGPELLVAAGEGSVIAVGRVKPAGGREISGADFANGRRLRPGDAIADGGS
jgi:methionyl-tRNA formyltransferase